MQDLRLSSSPWAPFNLFHEKITAIVDWLQGKPNRVLAALTAVEDLLCVTTSLWIELIRILVKHTLAASETAPYSLLECTLLLTRAHRNRLHGPWAKIVHYIGNSVPFQMQPHTGTITWTFLQSPFYYCTAPKVVTQWFCRMQHGYYITEGHSISLTCSDLLMFYVLMFWRSVTVLQLVLRTATANG